MTLENMFAIIPVEKCEFKNVWAWLFDSMQHVGSHLKHLITAHTGSDLPDI